jgi:hypothetical protein
MISTIVDHPWIVLIAIAVGLLRWLSQKGGAAKKESQQSDSPAPTQPIPRDDSRTEEERIRRFLEALGQPKGSTPPPKVAPKREIQPRVFPTLPPLTTAPPPLPASPASAAQKPPPIPMQRRVFAPAVVQETSFEVRDIGVPIVSDLSGGSRRATAEPQGLLIKLASTQGLRSAIVLREIFGPPRSLQPLDPISGF